jgi:hypothetical protein
MTVLDTGIVSYSAAIAPPCTSYSTRLARYAARWGLRMPALLHRRVPAPRQVAAEGWREDDGSRGVVTGLAAPIAASVGLAAQVLWAVLKPRLASLETLVYVPSGGPTVLVPRDGSTYYRVRIHWKRRKREK